MAAHPNFNWSASAILAEADALIAMTNKVWDQVGEMSLEEPTFESAILPISWAECEFERRFGVIGWFAAVSSDDNLREASKQVRLTLAGHRQGLWKRRDVFTIVNKIRESQRSDCTLDVESMVYVDLLHRKFVDGGLALQDDASVARLAEIENEIKTASSSYMQALDGRHGVWMMLDELRGVPESALLGWEADQDKRRVPLRVATCEMMLKHADLEETRKRMLLAFDNQAQDTNPALLHRLVVLRDEQARLLGYKHFADWHAAERMMAPDRALAFLQDAAERLARPVQSRIEMFQVIKRKQPHDLHAPDSCVDKIYSWDAAYYERLCRQQQFSVDEAALQEYFPFDQVLDRVLQIQSAAFGFRLVKLETQYPDNAWHEDVGVYEVYETDADEAEGGFVGYFFFDVYARDFKFGHRVSTYALSNTCVAQDGSRAPVASVFTANYARPASPKSPLLLTFKEVITCFHEVGHSFHNFSKTTSFWPLGYCARDFVEIPSILLEHFFWHPSIIRFLSGRRTADGREEKIPESTVAQLIASRFAGDIMHKAGLVRDAMVDLHMHMPEAHEDIVDMDILRHHRALGRDICQLAGPEDAGMEPDASKAASRYRFPVQYPASYYAYFLARAISYDMFETKFRPLMPPAEAVTLDQLISPELREECRRYQKIILQPAGRMAGRYMEAIQDYLGREPAVDAWIRQLDSAT